MAPEARADVESRPEKKFAVIILPAIVDLAEGRTYSYTGRIVIGAIYASWLRQRLAVALPPPPPHGR